MSAGVDHLPQEQRLPWLKRPDAPAAAAPPPPKAGEPPRRKKAKKKVKKNILTGVAHIQSTFNNTIVTITDVSGNVIAWSTAGARGFKGSRKSTPFAAQLAAEDAAAQGDGARHANVTVFVKGPGAGRESALRALAAAGLQDHAHPRRDADPAQRLPSAQAPPRLIRPVLRTETTFEEKHHGSLHRSASAGSAGAKT